MDSKNFAVRIAKKWKSGTQEFCSPDSKKVEVRIAKKRKSGWQDSCCPERQKSEGLKMLVKYIIKVFLYLILAVMTLIHWLLKIPMILGNILLYFLSIIFILTGVLSYGFALESARECGRMIISGMGFGAIPDFIPFLGKSLETLVDKLLSMTNE